MTFTPLEIFLLSFVCALVAGLVVGCAVAAWLCALVVPEEEP